MCVLLSQDSYSFTLRHLDDAGNVMYVAPSVPSRNSASTASAVPVIAV